MIRHLLRAHLAMKDPAMFHAMILLRQERERELAIKAAKKAARKERYDGQRAQDRAVMAELKEHDRLAREQKQRERQAPQETTSKPPASVRRRQKDREQRKAAALQARRARRTTTVKRDAIGRFSGSSRY